MTKNILILLLTTIILLLVAPELLKRLQNPTVTAQKHSPPNRAPEVTRAEYAEEIARLRQYTDEQIADLRVLLDARISE